MPAHASVCNCLHCWTVPPAARSLHRSCNWPTGFSVREPRQTITIGRAMLYRQTVIGRAMLYRQTVTEDGTVTSIGVFAVCLFT